MNNKYDGITLQADPPPFVLHPIDHILGSPEVEKLKLQVT